MENNQNLPVITEDDKKKMLQSAIWNLSQQQVFYGGLLQELTIKFNMFVPTAGITFNKKLSQYEIYINPYFFNSLTSDERTAVFHHEVLHFTNKHLFRLPFLVENVAEEEKRLFNLAGDMAINQYIKDLPKECVDYKQWKLDDGTIFPPFKSMEQYHELIKKEAKKQQESEDNKKEGKGGGTKGNVNEQLGKYKPFDVHDWEALDEETKAKMLEEAKKILKRTVEKTSFGHSQVPDSVKDLLDEIDALTASINYKQLLKNTIKKTVCFADRDNTWKKPNKKYGSYSPGTKVGSLPQLNIYIDTSGSISTKELNQFLNIMSNFLKAGTRNCQLGLWHTSLYHKQKYKLNKELRQDVVEAGGTDVNCVLQDINKMKPDLSIVLTDLYFDYPNVKTKGEIIWIVSEGGNQNHSFPKSQKVIYLDKLK